MQQMYINILIRIFPTLFSLQSTFRFLIRYPKSYLNTTGWLESNRRKYPCKPDGSPLPWLNYPTIALLEKRLNKKHLLFEYGSGYSTLFFANLVSGIVSVEYDKEWLDRINSMQPKNAVVHHVPKDIDGKYCRSILSSETNYHIFLIDGRDRINCIKQSIKKLTDDGVIIFDDSQRSEYQEAQLFMKDLGFLHLELEGLKPNSFELDSTSLFYRRNNCLGL